MSFPLVHPSFLQCGMREGWRKRGFSASVALIWQALRTKTHKHIHTQGVRGTHEAQGRLNYLDNKCSKSCCVSVWVCVPVGMLWGQNSLCCEVQLCELCKQLEKDKLTCTAVHTHMHTLVSWATVKDRHIHTKTYHLKQSYHAAYNILADIFNLYQPITVPSLLISVPKRLQ